MEKPDWIKKYKEPKTEIKWSNGHFYKYRVEYKYNKEKKLVGKLKSTKKGKVVMLMSILFYQNLLNDLRHH